jgi:hypothetical protein
MTSLVSPLWTEMVLMVVVGARGCCSPPVGPSSPSMFINALLTARHAHSVGITTSTHLAASPTQPTLRQLLTQILVSTATRRHSPLCRGEPKGNYVTIYSLSVVKFIVLCCVILLSKWQVSKNRRGRMGDCWNVRSTFFCLLLHVAFPIQWVVLNVAV